jgi:hypothetical protein
LPVDPADVRKVVLEEGLAVDSDKVRELRERLFASWGNELGRVQLCARISRCRDKRKAHS